MHYRGVNAFMLSLHDVGVIASMLWLQLMQLDFRPLVVITTLTGFHLLALWMHSSHFLKQPCSDRQGQKVSSKKYERSKFPISDNWRLGRYPFLKLRRVVMMTSYVAFLSKPASVGLREKPIIDF